MPVLFPPPPSLRHTQPQHAAGDGMCAAARPPDAAHARGGARGHARARPFLSPSRTSSLRIPPHRTYQAMYVPTPCEAVHVRARRSGSRSWRRRTSPRRRRHAPAPRAPASGPRVLRPRSAPEATRAAPRLTARARSWGRRARCRSAARRRTARTAPREPSWRRRDTPPAPCPSSALSLTRDESWSHFGALGVDERGGREGVSVQ